MTFDQLSAFGFVQNEQKSYDFYPEWVWGIGIGEREELNLGMGRGCMPHLSRNVNYFWNMEAIDILQRQTNVEHANNATVLYLTNILAF